MELKQVKTNKRFFNKAQNLRNIIAIVEEYKIKNPLFGTYKNAWEDMHTAEIERDAAVKEASDYYYNQYQCSDKKTEAEYLKLKEIERDKKNNYYSLSELRTDKARDFINDNITIDLYMIIKSSKTIKNLVKIFGAHLDGFLLEALREYKKNGGFTGEIIEINAKIENKYKNCDFYEHYIKEYTREIEDLKKEIENENKIIDCIFAYCLADDKNKKQLFNSKIDHIDYINDQIEIKQENINKLVKDYEKSKIAVDEFNNKKAEFLKAYDFFGLTLEQPKVKQATNDFSFDFNDEIKQEVKKSNKNRL